MAEADHPTKGVLLLPLSLLTKQFRHLEDFWDRNERLKDSVGVRAPVRPRQIEGKDLRETVRVLHVQHTLSFL